MARTVSSRFGISYVNPATRDEPADVPADIKLLVDAFENSTPMYLQGTIGARPAASKVGRLYFATNEGIVYYDNGTAWSVIGPAPPLGITTAQLADDAVTLAKMANDSVGAAELTANAVESLYRYEADNRTVATIPNDYNDGFRTRFRNLSALGITDTGTHAQVIGYRAWSDSSGGNAHEFAYTDSGNVWHRYGLTTTWNAWQKMLQGSVGSAEIQDGSIGTVKLATDAVTQDKMANDSVGAAEIIALAVGNSELAADSVTADKIAADAVGTSEIAADSVGASEIAPLSITDAEIAAAAAIFGRKFQWSESATPPGSPQEGDIWIMHPIAGVTWMFRYDPTDDAGLPWAFVGGAAFPDQDDAAVTMTSSAYSDYTGGPTLTIARAGAYHFHFGVTFANPGDTVNTALYAALKYGAAATSDSDSIVFHSSAPPAGGVTESSSVSRVLQRNDITAGMVVKIQLRAVASTICTAEKRFLWATPLRVA